MESNYLAVIKVVGVGGGGTNAVTRMVDAGLRGVDFIAINTDAQVLMETDADVKLAIGKERTHGLGAGANPSVGREAAEESRDEQQRVRPHLLVVRRRAVPTVALERPERVAPH